MRHATETGETIREGLWRVVPALPSSQSATPRHLGPALNAEKAPGPLARRVSDVGRKK